ncbi:MAG: transketolase [Lachnospiraceae bacterium]|nr:transketolase [Lachnospiraceae bacterium]
MELKAANVRRRILDMAYRCGKNVHIGGSLSMADILTVLYRDVMNIKVSDMQWDDRDRFILSKGHCVLALYAVMAEMGVMCDEEIESYMQDGSVFGSHPVMNVEHGVECSSGSLGQGVSMAVGIAKAAKLKKRNYNIYTLVGNGECDEGSVWEAFMLAGQWKLDNLTFIIDNNRIQSDGRSEDIIDLSNISQRLNGFGLNVIEIDGHDETELLSALKSSFENLTKVIVCNTVKGKGVSFMENNNEWHHNRLIEETYKKAIEEVGI